MESTNHSQNVTNSTSTADAAENSITSVETLKEQLLSATGDESVPNLSHSANAMDPSSYDPYGSLNPYANYMFSSQPNTSAPQAQIYNYGAYDNFPAEEEDYRGHFADIDAVDAVSTGNYGENRSPMYHTGYGYNLQVPYGLYYPVTTSLPSSGVGQLYYPHYFYSPCPCLRQRSSSNASYLSTTTPASLAELTMPVERQDLVRSPEGTVSVSPTASREPIDPVGSFRRGILSPAMVSQQQTPFSGLGSSINSHNQGYFHDGRHQHENNFGSSTHRMINDGRSLITTDQRRQGQGNASTRSFRDHLNEQRRGPRATRRRNITNEQGLSLESKNRNTPGVDRELYNMPDFNIDYKDAKFFIIKSYIEENIYKSIKYGVWASTVNGNNKLDAAYCAAKRKVEPCPVFLFFSVNASSQFCGVAEMIGCVDFDQSVDYWQQDKWSGMFPVKWHIIKDVPNVMFRHIFLESNDNRPVTNSRDAQEVKFEYGVDMLGIFKNYEIKLSILDDIEHYEKLEKAQQESQSRRSPPQQQHLEEMPQPLNIASAISLGAAGGQLNPAPMHDEPVGQITRNFTNVVRLGKVGRDCGSSDRSIP